MEILNREKTETAELSYRKKAEPILSIKGLTVAFHSEKHEMVAVEGVDLTLNKGEILALVGESGCGKTVLCKSMLHLLCQRGEVKSGEAFLGGTDLISLSEKEVVKLRGKEIAMIFQDPLTSLNPSMPVGKQIAEVVEIHAGASKSLAKKKTLELLKLVGIDHPERRFSQPPHEFSGGMRQRAAIAIALAGNPKVILADEPTTALDLDTRYQILNLLGEIRKKTGTAIIFISHDLSLVESFADRTAVMLQGRIVEEGTTSHIFQNPSHEYSKRLLRYANYGTGREHTHGRKRTYGESEVLEGHGGIKGHEGLRRHEGDERTEEEPLLAVSGVTMEFSLDRRTKITPLDRFSLTLHHGEILGLVGPSGCGKSTLAKCIMGIYKPTSGRIDYFGKNRQIIFQDSMSAFNPRMTIEEIIAEPLAIQRKYSREEIREAVCLLLDRVELSEELLSRHPYEISGGQRQRAAIARAISLKPDLLIADEPVASLDVSIQAQIVHLFKKLQEEEGLAVLLIAHDLPMVEHVSDRIVHLSKEKMI